MINMITLFYERAHNAQSDTAIIDAAKEATDGKPELLADQMFSLAAYRRIDITAVLEKYRAETTEAKAAAEKKKQAGKTIETTEAIKEHIEELIADLKKIPDINTPAIQEKIAAIRLLSTALIPVNDARTIFPTLTDIFAEWDAYDPEKDFRPPLLAGTAIKDGTLSYIGARTGIGKTTTLINITREALNAGRKVIFLTLEEPARDILRKLILCELYATATSTDRKTLRDFAIEKGDLTAVFHTARKGGFLQGDKKTTMLFKDGTLQVQKKIIGLYGNRLIFCEGRSIDTAEKTAATIAKHATSGDIVLVDFIQRIADPAGEKHSNYMKGKAQSETLFSIAKNTSAAVISGAQFKRATSELSPTLAPLGFKPFDETSFREAGDIEQDGDYLFGIGDHTDAESQQRFLKILKVRSGSGRGRCFEIDFQGAFNYMGIGERLTQMNPEYKPSKKPTANTPSTTKVYNKNGSYSEIEFNGEEPL